VHRADLHRILFEAMPGDPKRAPKIESWQQRTPLQPRFVVDLLTALVTPLGRFDEALNRLVIFNNEDDR